MYTKLYKMNEIVNKFLLAGNLDLLIVLVVHLLKIKKELKNLKKQEIQAIFTKINLIKLVFKMTWLMEILKI